MTTWDDKTAHVLASLQGSKGAEAISAIADLAMEVPESVGDAWFDTHPDWPGVAEVATRLYYDYIVDNETRDIARLLALDQGQGSAFRDLVSQAGRVAYDRVADMFAHVDFSRCERLAMVGCGQLPVTALHVMERAHVPHIDLLDVSPKAIESVTALKHKFGWDALHPVLCDGADFDFAGADVVYVANMVRGKVATVRRALSTTRADLQLVVRDPYSLGRLWADKSEPFLVDAVDVLGRGPVSRHLSRDIYLRKRERH